MPKLNKIILACKHVQGGGGGGQKPLFKEGSFGVNDHCDDNFLFSACECLIILLTELDVLGKLTLNLHKIMVGNHAN